MKLMIKQRVFSWGEKFDIYDEQGNVKYFVKGELFSDKIYVYLPNLNGEVIEIPKGANIVDLACYMNLENILIGAKVNDEIVPIDYILESKDRVIVLTDDLAYGNRKNLIEKANTEYAKMKIKKGGV